MDLASTGSVSQPERAAKKAEAMADPNQVKSIFLAALEQPPAQALRS